MQVMTIVIILLTIFAVYEILTSFGVFEFNFKPQKVVSNAQAEKKDMQKRKFEKQKLDFYAGVTNMFRGLIMTPTIYENHEYYIQRLELRSKVLNRFYTPEEYRGKYAFFVLVSLFFIPIAIFVPILFAVPALALFVYLSYPATLKQQIQDEDIIIDNNFLNLYLLMYSKLKMGSRARLQGVVESYIDTMQNETDVRTKNTMIKLSRFMLNNLSQFEDHVAIPKLRERYNSATIINFCNVASQALQGVDNADNLLTFKMQLVERKTSAMERRSEKIFAQGQRSIYLIWVILFFFVACGWYSKIPTQGLF